MVAEVKINVLDSGYVEFIEAWGHGRPGVDKSKEQFADGVYSAEIDMEAGIIEAARQSTQGAFRGWEPKLCSCAQTWKLNQHSPDCDSVKFPGDAKLLQFLYSHKHFTPFEFSGMVIEVQAPIFVFREWHRHRTQSYNEMSARYAPLPDLYYIPEIQRVLRTSDTNKQAQAVQGSTSKVEDINEWRLELSAFYREAEVLYKAALDSGIPKELARLSMPVGHYSRMRASANLRNWLSFLTLRCAPEAQWEIRQFALAVEQIIANVFPRTHELWTQYSLYGDTSKT